MEYDGLNSGFQTKFVFLVIMFPANNNGEKQEEESLCSRALEVDLLEQFDSVVFINWSALPASDQNAELGPRGSLKLECSALP